jgi:hypothetical protein
MDCHRKPPCCGHDKICSSGSNTAYGATG